MENAFWPGTVIASNAYKTSGDKYVFNDSKEGQDEIAGKVWNWQRAFWK